MIIVEIRADNFKRVRTVNIKPDGTAVIIGGENEQGKSSMLDAIQALLGGGNSLPDDPIRHGAKSAEIFGNLGDITATRKFTKSGSTLTVQAKDGAKYSSPQKMLDALVGELSFDPLEFSRKSAKEQAAILRQLSGVDTRELGAKRAALFAERTDANRDIKRVTARLDAAPHHEDAPAEAVSVAELSEKLRAVEKTNAAADKARDVSAAAHKGADAWAERVAIREQELQDAIDAKKRELKSAADSAEEARRTAHAKTKEWRAAEDLVVPTVELEVEIANADSLNQKVRDNNAHEDLSFEVEAAREESERLTGEMKAIDEDIAKQTAASVYPIDGLSIDEDGVSYNGVTFKQASQAQKIKVSVAIGLALNPKLKVLLIRDGSFLDAKNLKLVGEMAAKADAQVWIERVGKGDECTVIIEDGALV